MHGVENARDVWREETRGVAQHGKAWEQTHAQGNVYGADPCHVSYCSSPEQHQCTNKSLKMCVIFAALKR